MKTRCYDGKKWQYEFKYEGKRYRKKGFRTKREANSAGLDKLNELRQGFNFENNLTFEDYFKNWIETYKENIVSENTFRHYRFTLKHIQRHKIGKVEISKINKQMYQKFINDFSENRAKETIRKTNGAIKSALEDAVYDGLIAKNPTYKITFKAGKTTKSEEEK
ncbi:TPA: phage integrase SAM-like domain-containing protein, partial [Staphylococcus pseudintermedius]|nr:phage integrase SAM-like domain-containing protein [Staphylococcus pseudintermedius]